MKFLARNNIPYRNPQQDTRCSECWLKIQAPKSDVGLNLALITFKCVHKRTEMAHCLLVPVLSFLLCSKTPECSLNYLLITDESRQNVAALNNNND